MRLDHEFVVPASLNETWRTLTDLRLVASCMPGAALTEVVDDEYRGTVKVKAGPISMQYRGVARFIEKVDSEYRAVISAEGKDVKAGGRASAIVTAQLAETGEGTRVTVTTELDLTGRVAQFGRGIITDISSKLLDQFADALRSVMSGEGRDVRVVLDGGGAVAGESERSGGQTVAPTVALGPQDRDAAQDPAALDVFSLVDRRWMWGLGAGLLLAVMVVLAGGRRRR
jgi:carbon monoxide dehydrogenase subunit G